MTVTTTSTAEAEVSTLVQSLEVQVTHVISVLTAAGVDLRYSVCIPGEHNWRLGQKGLEFGDTRTRYTASQFAAASTDAANGMMRLIAHLAHMTHPDEVARLRSQP